MKQVVRAQYRAVIKAGTTEEQLKEAVEQSSKKMQEKLKHGEILTAGMFRYRNLIFLYLEYIVEETSSLLDGRKDRINQIPDQWLDFMKQILHIWPEYSGQQYWAYMYPVFWFDQPVSLEYWRRKKKPDARCGRIAVLYPDKFASYICHHHAIVEEGLLVGDRYQMISSHENLLFSYFETPRDREQVNIKHQEKESEEIEKWEAVNPESHFIRFEEDPENNFMPPPGVITVREAPEGRNLRLDSAAYAGFEVSLHYDPMIAKLCCWGRTRESAISNMARALREYKILGIKTTIPFHQRVLKNAAFLEGKYDTTFIDTRFDKEDLKRRQNTDPTVAVIAAAVRHYEREKEAASRATTLPVVGESLWKYYGKLQMTANNY